MGIFDKLFGKSNGEESSSRIDTSNLGKTAEMLDEDKFWVIIERSLKYKFDQDAQEAFLVSEIAKLSPNEMIGFRLRTDYFLHHTYNSEMWCAAYIMNGGCSDDGFEYFRCWVISKGKDVFYNARNNPDSLATEVIDGAEYDFESFWYVALDAFEQRTGQDLYDYIDSDNFKTKEGNYPQFEFNWQEGDPESMKRICPKLFAAFNE